MCGAPHLRIHSSFRSAVFDSACQLRVSFLFRLRRCRVVLPSARAAGAVVHASRPGPVLLATAPSRAARTQCIDSRPGDACQHLVVKSTTRAYSEPERDGGIATLHLPATHKPVTPRIADKRYTVPTQCRLVERNRKPPLTTAALKT